MTFEGLSKAGLTPEQRDEIRALPPEKAPGWFARLAWNASRKAAFAEAAKWHKWKEEWWFDAASEFFGPEHAGAVGARARADEHREAAAHFREIGGAA